MYISNDNGLSISLTVVLFQFLLFSECRVSYNCYNHPEHVLKADEQEIYKILKVKTSFWVGCLQCTIVQLLMDNLSCKFNTYRN